MKKISLLLAVVGIVGSAHAWIIDWASGTLEGGLPASIGNGAIVALYQDVGGNNSAGWQTTANALQVNTDLTVAGGSLGMADDLFLGETTFLIENAGFKYLNQVIGIDLSDGTSIYTVIYDSTADGGTGLVIDLAPYVVAGDASYYADNDGLGTDDGNYHNIAGTLGGVSVIPESATVGLYGFFGLALLWIRRAIRR